MDDIGGVHEQQSPQDLVHEVLYMLVTQVLPTVYHPVQVRLHELGDDVDIDVASPRLRLQQVHHIYYVLMLEEFYHHAILTQHLDLPHYALGIDQVIECIYDLHHECVTFLMATFLLVCLFNAEATTPYAPEPTCLMISYF